MKLFILNKTHLKDKGLLRGQARIGHATPPEASGDLVSQIGLGNIWSVPLEKPGSIALRAGEMLSLARRLAEAVLHNSRVIVARQQCQQRHGCLAAFVGCLPCAPVAIGHPGFSP